MDSASGSTCVECGAENRLDASRCWLCGRSLGAVAAAPVASPMPGAQVPGTAAQHRARPTFRLSSLMLTITLIAVWLGVVRQSPVLAVGLAIVAAPALLRTALISGRSRARGTPLAMNDKLMLFLGSVGVVIAVGGSAGIAFVLTCTTTFFGGAAISSAAGSTTGEPVVFGLMVGLALGAIGGIVVGIALLRRLWPE